MDPRMDSVTRAVLGSVRRMGYVVCIDAAAATRIAVSARNIRTGESFVVRGDDFYFAACELAERVGIELDDG